MVATSRRVDPEERCSCCGNWFHFKTLDYNGMCPHCRETRQDEAEMKVDQKILEEGI